MRVLFKGSYVVVFEGDGVYEVGGIPRWVLEVTGTRVVDARNGRLVVSGGRVLEAARYAEVVDGLPRVERWLRKIAARISGGLPSDSYTPHSLVATWLIKREQPCWVPPGAPEVEVTRPSRENGYRVVVKAAGRVFRVHPRDFAEIIRGTIHFLDIWLDPRSRMDPVTRIVDKYKPGERYKVTSSSMLAELAVVALVEAGGDLERATRLLASMISSVEPEKDDDVYVGVPPDVLEDVRRVVDGLVTVKPEVVRLPGVRRRLEKRPVIPELVDVMVDMGVELPANYMDYVLETRGVKGAVEVSAATGTPIPLDKVTGSRVAGRVPVRSLDELAYIAEAARPFEGMEPTISVSGGEYELSLRAPARGLPAPRIRLRGRDGSICTGPGYIHVTARSLGDLFRYAHVAISLYYGLLGVVPRGELRFRAGSVKVEIAAGELAAEAETVDKASDALLEALPGVLTLEKLVAEKQE